jgi:hypothetical protein
LPGRRWNAYANADGNGDGFGHANTDRNAIAHANLHAGRFTRAVDGGRTIAG